MGNSLETYILIVLLIKSKVRNPRMRAFGEHTGEISNFLLCFLICTLILTGLHALVCLHFNQEAHNTLAHFLMSATTDL